VVTTPRNFTGYLRSASDAERARSCAAFVNHPSGAGEGSAQRVPGVTPKMTVARTGQKEFASRVFKAGSISSTPPGPRVKNGD